MSNQVNRKIAPDAEELKNIFIIEGKKVSLKNGLDLHYISAENTEVLRVDFVFDGGIRKQTQPGVAVATNAMLSEGTKNYTSRQIADHLDFYGSYFQTQCNADDSTITLYCLKKHFSACIPVILDIINNSIFPEEELNIYKKNAIQRLIVNQERNSFLNKRLFYSSVFGETHPYGSFSKSIDYEIISRETVEKFFISFYKNKIKYILIVGAVDEQLLKDAENYFFSLTSSPYIHNHLISTHSNLNNIFLEKPDSIQSAIRIGRKLFPRTHPDFRKMQILNLILGGYFGSRLMKNIREEKGLTYGIHSVVESYKDDGCFYIDTEINNELREIGITEIYKEIKILRQDLIPGDELNLAKNYMLGAFLRSIDGPFSLADKYKILIDCNLDYSFYTHFIDTIKQTSAKELRDLANQYLQQDDLIEVVVGKK